MHIRFLPLTLLCAAQLCAAGELYRVVGPDGKVSYTDRPQSTEGLTAIRGSGMKSAVSGLSGGSGALGASGPAREPALAAVRFVVSQMLVESLTGFCASYVPDSAPAVRAAGQAHAQRNDNLASKSSRILRDLLTTDELVIISRKMEEENKAYYAKAARANPSMKRVWCAELPRQLTGREMDPSSDPTMVRAVLDYKFRNGYAKAGPNG